MTLKPWQVTSGPEWALRLRLAGTEARTIALGMALVISGVAVLYFGEWWTFSTPQIAEGWSQYRGVAATWAVLAAIAGGVGLMFLRAWGRWALLPLVVVGALSSASWTFATLLRDTADPEAQAASTPEGRQTVVYRGVIWIVAAALPALLVGRRRARVVCSANYRFAVGRTPRPYLLWWLVLVAWLMGFLGVAYVLSRTEIDMKERMPTFQVNGRRPG